MGSRIGWMIGSGGPGRRAVARTYLYYDRTVRSVIDERKKVLARELPAEI